MLKYFRLIGFAVLFLNALANVGRADAEQFLIDPELINFKFSTLKTIPEGPNPNIDGSPCDYFVKPTFEYEFRPSQSIQNSGWKILSEAQLGTYQIVAFAGAFYPGTSGVCRISQSNIAIFEKNQLIGILYLDSLNAASIGNLRLMDGGFIRVFSGGEIQVPTADIHLSINGFEIKPTSMITAYCDGRSIVPSVIGTSITDARKTLFNYGFDPLTVTDPSIVSWRKYLIDYGIHEVDACSGTGFAFCSFNYKNEVSSVRLITAGEDHFPTVVRVNVTCE